MQSKFELNRTKAVDLRRIGNFNQANVLNNLTGLLLGTQEYTSKGRIVILGRIVFGLRANFHARFSP